MKDLKLSAEAARELYTVVDNQGKSLLEKIAGKEFFAARPLGVWILTANGEAVKAQDWARLHSDTPETKAVGVGVVTEQTSFIISLRATAALQWGATGFDDYPNVCKDQESFDNEAATLAIIERHKGIECKYNDSAKFDFIGAPAAEWCRSLGSMWSLPTLATTKVIAEHIKAINEALRVSEGFTIPSCWLCTSTVNTEDCTYLCVRAVSTFRFENFDFLTF